MSSGPYHPLYGYGPYPSYHYDRLSRENTYLREQVRGLGNTISELRRENARARKIMAAVETYNLAKDDLLKELRS